MRAVEQTAGAGPFDGPQPAAPRAGRRWRRRRATVGLLTVLAVVAAGAAVAAAKPWADGSGHTTTSGIDNEYPTSLATVSREDLSSVTEVNATLGYAGSYQVAGQLSGTVTWLPAAGTVVKQGQAIYKVDDLPVVLLYGSVPAYRTLAKGDSGPDVLQLKRDLVALGDAKRSQLDLASDTFGSTTAAAVKLLQKHFGLTQTGSLALGRVVFLPTAARVSAVSATLGGSATGPVLSATSTKSQVSIALDASQQSEVKVGDTVQITLPDGATTPGRVSFVGSVASSNGNGGSTVTVDVTPTDPAATAALDQAPVTVAVTEQSVSNVLAVPVDALIALAGGGYAVEVDTAGVHHLVPVSVGLFDSLSNTVQVSGAGLATGQRVVVPGS